MLIEVSLDNLQFFECFASETRVKIIELLNLKPMNIKDLSAALDVSSAITTRHIQKLVKANIITYESIAGKRGMQKVCSLSLDQATLQIKNKKNNGANRSTISIPVGQYSNCQASSTCGLASDTKIIGMIDDPRYFADPEHIHAKHIWFASGFVEYRTPNYLLKNQVLQSIEISLEMCSEAPGYNEDWPSDISFYLNNIYLGMWTCPGDYGSNRGVFTPDWWHQTQHGLLKTITVNGNGSFIDGLQLSGVTISELGLSYGKEIAIKIASPEDAKNCGGLSLFGKGFGNYNQNIEVVLTFG